MTVAADTGAYPQAVIDEFKRLAEECSICYQCGTCTSSCPSGRELYSGPRRLVRLILSGEIEAVLKSDDLWRCTECGTCTEVCRMDIDVASLLSRLRKLEHEYGGTIRCPERTAADVAAARLRKQPRIDNLRFGVAMMVEGHFPKDKVGAAESGMKIVKQMLPLGGKRAAGEAVPAARGTTTQAAARPTLLHENPCQTRIESTIAAPREARKNPALASPYRRGTRVTRRIGNACHRLPEAR